MLTIVAGFMIIAASTGLGFAVAEGYANRPRQLRQFQQALTMLQSEIRYRHTPLPYALSLVARRTGMPVSRIFRELGDALIAGDGRGLNWAWGQVIKEIQLSLNHDDLDILDSLMQGLGMGTAKEQERQLDLHLHHLAQQELQADKTRQTSERMWRYLGVLTGVALVIILL